MPPAGNKETSPSARPKIKPPTGSAGAKAGLETPKASTRKVEKAKPTQPSLALTAEETAQAPAAAIRAKSAKSSQSEKPAVPKAGSKGGYAASTGNKKRSKLSRAERLEEEEQVDYGTEGGWNLEKWIDSLQIHKLIADVIGDGKEDKQPYEHAKALTREEIEKRLGARELGGLADAIWEGVEMLQDQSAATGADLNHKFHMDGAGFEMSFGSLDLFFGGLEMVVGPPRMINGSLLHAMRDEHTSEKDARLPFISSNGMSTTSETEWEFVNEPDNDKTYPERKDFRTPSGQESDPDKCRRKRSIASVKSEMEEFINSSLRDAGHTEMIIEEAIAARLYTGPMYEKYNLALRKESQAPFLIDRFKKICKDNNYATTIHAINSAVLKLSKLTEAVKVWRGFSGATLPKSFFARNSAGVRGGIEYGFSSTTTERATALSFSRGDCSTIFEMQMGMVDRGAELTWLSQYPHEKEVLFPPLTGLEVLNTEVDHSTLVVVTRLSLNMASLTLEQVISRRRKTLMDMAEGMKSEIRHAFDGHEAEDELAERGTKILTEAMRHGPLAQSPDWFNDDENFASSVTQALGCKQGVVRGVTRLPMKAEHVSLQGWKLQLPGRALLFAGWLRSAPAVTSIDLRECNLTPTEALSIASTVDRAPKLVAIDVRKNESMAEVVNGITATGAVESLVKVLKSGGKLRSLCGVTSGNSTLDVPRCELPLVDSLLLAAELEASTWIEGIASEQGSRSSCAKLMRKGADRAMSWQDGWYPLIWAAKDGNTALVNSLLDRGMPIDQMEEEKSSQGFTPLMWASSRGHEATVVLLLRRGANPRMVERHNKNAAMLAEQRGFTKIRELIEEHMPETICDVVARAQVIKTAAEKLKRLKEEDGAKVDEAAKRMQAMTRGKSSRNMFADLVAEHAHKPSSHSNGDDWGTKAKSAAAAAAAESKAYGEQRSKSGKHATIGGAVVASEGSPAKAKPSSPASAAASGKDASGREDATGAAAAGSASVGLVAARVLGVSRAKQQLKCLVGAKAVIVRAEADLKSEKVGELKEGTAVSVLDTRAMADGIIRVAVALGETPAKLYGWITGAKEDGAETLQVTAESASVLIATQQSGSHGLVAILHGHKQNDAAVEIQRIEKGRSTRALLDDAKKKETAKAAAK